MSLLIWGTRPKAIDLGPAGERECPRCGQRRSFRYVLDYQLNHLYYVFGFTSRRQVARGCTVCGYREPLTATAVTAAIGADPSQRIPVLERFGCLGALGGVAALVLLGIALRAFGPETRDVPALIEGVRHGDAASLAHLEREANADDAPSQEALMDLYQHGDGVPADPAQAFKWASRAAAHGVPRAEHALGAMYESGKGTAVDNAQAMAWYQKAAAQGIAASANSIGALYLQGLGVAANPAEAVRWFRKAAEAGDPQACFNLAMRYRAGEGVAADPAQTRGWLERAAAAPGMDRDSRVVVAAAKLELGHLYEEGEGIPRDMVKALHYYEDASSVDDQARQEFDRLKAKLSSK